MISSIGSTGQTDIASLLQSKSNTQRMPPQGQKPPSTEEMFQSLDADGDGSVTESEFTDGMEKMKESQGTQPPPPPPDGEQPSTEDLFAKIDSDGDGKVSLGELQSDFESRKTDRTAQSNTTTDISELFGKLDSDSDGLIGESEFSKLFEAMDQLRQNKTGATYSQGSSSSSSTTSLLGYA